MIGDAGAVEQPDAFAPILRTILTGLEKGELDRNLITSDCSAYFSRSAVQDFQSSLAPLGSITAVQKLHTALRGGMTFAEYRVGFSGGDAILVTIYLLPDGRIEQLLVIGKA